MSTVQASSKMLSLIDRLADSKLKSADLVNECIKQATAEHLSASDCKELLTIALKKRGLQKSQIYSLIPEEFKRSYDKVRQESQSPMNGQSEDSMQKADDIAKLRKEFDAMQSEVKQLRTFLQPFKAVGELELRGQILPVIAKIDPQGRSIISLQVDEEKARRLFA